jgi:hypothetical protein
VESFEKVYELYWENPGTYVDTTTAYAYQEKGFAAGLGLFSQITENEDKYPFAAYKTYRDMIGAKNNGITTYYESNKAIAEEYVASFREYVEQQIQ